VKQPIEMMTNKSNLVRRGQRGQKRDESRVVLSSFNRDGTIQDKINGIRSLNPHVEFSSIFTFPLVIQLAD